MLRNAVGGRWGSAFLEKSVTEVYGSTLLALRGGWVGVKFPGKKRYVTLEWPLTSTRGTFEAASDHSYQDQHLVKNSQFYVSCIRH